jgi:hypothetical protein
MKYQFTLRDTMTAIIDEYARRHKPAAGQLGLFEKPSEKQKPLFSKKVDDESGKWVTMRGARVFISGEDGRIMKGPKALMGKTKEQIEKESAGKEGAGDKAPKPKPLAEMGRISGGRADNRQKKLFEELNPGFKFVDDEDEDFKTVEPAGPAVPMAETPSSPAEDEPDDSFEQQVLNGIKEKLESGDTVTLVTNTKATQFDRRHVDMFRVKNGSLQVQRGKNWDNIAFGPLDHLASQVGVDRPETDFVAPEEEEDILSADFVNDHFNGDAGAAIEAMELNRKNEINRANELGVDWNAAEIDADWMAGVMAAAEESGGDQEDSEPTFTLDSTPQPSPSTSKPEDFGKSDSTKQGALFDTGKGDLPRQELLFNSDAGDLNNPKTMENRAKQSPDDVPKLTDDERSRLPEHLKTVTPLFASEANRLKEMAAKANPSSSPAVSTTKSPEDTISEHLENNDHESAYKAFAQLKKDQIDSVARKVLGSGFYNKSKTEMLQALKRALPFATKQASDEAQKKEEIGYAEMMLKRAKENQQAHSEDRLGAPIRPGVPEIAYTDPHGEGRAEVAKAWQAEVDDAQRELDRVSGKQASAEEEGPNDGDINAEGLVFRNGRWHRDGEEISPSDIAAKARENGESIWTAAKRELGLNSMGEIPPELRKELGDAMAATSAGKAPEVKPPSPGRQRAMERQEEKQKQDEQAEKETPPLAVEPEPVAPVNEAEESGNTPREQAGHYYDTQKHNEYAWARESEVGNAGKDLIGSARHKRNEWRTLEELEERGSAVAEELITRSNLMKNNPPNLAVAAERNPVTALAMHMALNAIPARPYGVKSGEVHVDTEKKKLARKLYVEAFNSLREKAEELAMREDDPMKALSEFANHADKIRQSYKAQAGTYVSEQFNHMVTIHNRTQTSLRGGGYLDLNRPVGRRDKSTDASTNIRKFAALARENYGPDWMESEDVQEKAIDVITGSSIDKVFDITKEKSASGKYKFNPSEAYVTGKTERKGGPSVDTSTVKKSQDVLLSSLAVSGLQYGNSMTDDERKHHTAKAAEAMVDLADALGLPDKAVGMNGKLGIAFGARGRAGAKAHYEPNLNVINLTRKTGAGSLAHEWAHFVDYNTGEDGDKQQTKSRQGNQKALKESWEAARSRIMDAVSKAYSHLGSDSRWAQVRYWTSDEEMFARFSERMVQKKLHDQGRENSYLVGLQKNSHPFWPTDSELEKSMPHLESIYKKFGDDFEKEHGKEPKKDRYSRIREVMESMVDSYVRPEDEVIQVEVDRYAHPLVQAAVGAGAHLAINSVFKGQMRSVMNMALGAAMAAWVASSAPQAQAGQTNQPAAIQQSAPMTPGQKQAAGNNAVNQIVARAMAQHNQNAQAAANAPPSPTQQAAHSISAAAAGKAGVPGVRPLTGGNAAGIPAVQPAAQSPAQTQTAGKGGARPLRDPGDSGGGNFSNSDHPRQPAGASESKGGQFAPKGGAESGSSSGEFAPEASSSPADGDSGEFDVWHSPKTSPDQGYSGAASAGLGDAFATDNHDYAAQYGTPEKHTATMKNPYQMNAAEFRSFDRGPDASFAKSKAKRDELQGKGHDGIIVTHADGAKEHILFDKNNLKKQGESPRNYPDNLNKPASEQTDYSPPERSIEPPVRQSRKAAWEKTLRDMAELAVQKKESEKAEKKQAKEMAKATSFNPAELEAESSQMIDDIDSAGEAPKEDDFDSAKDYEKAIEKHNRSTGAKQATIKKRANANLIPEIAGEHDLDHSTLEQAVNDEIAMLLPYHNRKEEARQYISKMGWNARRINQAEDRGIDSSSTKFDDVASQWADMFPEIAGSDESEWVAKMWDLSREGVQDPPSASDEELVKRVAKRLAESGASSSPADSDSESDYEPYTYNPEDPESTPFSRTGVVSLIVDKYMRQLGLC